MKNKFIYIVFVGSFLIASCSSSEDKKDDTPPTQQATVPSVYDDINLELDNGVKWKVSENMTPAMQASFDLIDKASATENPDYNQLANELDKLKNKFIEACDMTGKSHEELHDWLIPYLGLLDNLLDAESTEDAEHAFNEILVAKEVYLAHFE